MEGFILCGGRSSRFGSDKALAVWRGRPLVAHVVETWRGAGLTPRLITPDAAPYARWARAFVMCERPGRGPLEGVRVALTTSAAAWALVGSVDMPAVRPRHLHRLLIEGQRASSPPPAVIFTDGSRRHPFPGLYHRSHLAVLGRLPEESSMQDLLDRLPQHVLGGEEGGAELLHALTNVNAPEDLVGLSQHRDPPG